MRNTGDLTLYLVTWDHVICCPIFFVVSRGKLAKNSCKFARHSTNQKNGTWNIKLLFAYELLVFFWSLFPFANYVITICSPINLYFLFIHRKLRDVVFFYVNSLLSSFVFFLFTLLNVSSFSPEVRFFFTILATQMEQIIIIYSKKHKNVLLS